MTDGVGPAHWHTTLHDTLRAIAQGMMKRERIGHTLQPTAIVHEAWLRLAEHSGSVFDSRERFVSYAARVMRNLLVDHARALATMKRDPGETVPLDSVLHIVVSEERLAPVPMLDLHDALERLAANDAELAHIVELRFLAGLTLEETGAVLGKTVRQVRRAWDLARAWLLRELSRGDADVE